jgi:hypothetical protein
MTLHVTHPLLQSPQEVNQEAGGGGQSANMSGNQVRQIFERSAAIRPEQVSNIQLPQLFPAKNNQYCFQ